MNHNAVRMWIRKNEPLLDGVRDSIKRLSANCSALAGLNLTENAAAIPELLNPASDDMTRVLDDLTAASRIPDLPLDLMMAGAIGKLRRCIGNPVSAHLEAACPDGCEHQEIEEWADQCVTAMRAWDRFHAQLCAA